MKKLLGMFLVCLFMMSMRNSINFNERPDDCLEYAENIEELITDGGCNAEIASLAYDYCMIFTAINDD